MATGQSLRRALAMAAAVTLVVVVAAAAANGAAAQACARRVARCNPRVDYFRNKVKPIAHATTLSGLRYTNTYVDVTVQAEEGKAPIRYRFVRCGCRAPAAGRVRIYVPPAKVYVGDTSTLSQVVLEIGSLDRVAVIGSVFYTYSPTVRRRVAAGRIASLTPSSTIFTPPYAQLLNASLTKVRGSSTPLLALIPSRAVKTFKEAVGNRIPYVTSGELDEVTPLGRAEYVKFFGIVMDRSGQADDAYDAIVRRYNNAKRLAARARARPSTLVGFPFGGVWTQPGEKEYSARFLADANADHRYQRDGKTLPTSLTGAQIVRDFGSAEVWVNAGLYPSSPSLTLDQLLADDPKLTANVFSKLRSVQCGRVWSNQRRVSADGLANDYFEEGAVRPDKILEDLVRLFHPSVRVPGDFHFYYWLGRPSRLRCPTASLFGR
ncbi:hypothetical protein MMPV_009638 [Pyropia vietnamensis]